MFDLERVLLVTVLVAAVLSGLTVLGAASAGFCRRVLLCRLRVRRASTGEIAGEGRSASMLPARAKRHNTGLPTSNQIPACLPPVPVPLGTDVPRGEVRESRNGPTHWTGKKGTPRSDAAGAFPYNGVNDDPSLRTGDPTVRRFLPGPVRFNCPDRSSGHAANAAPGGPAESESVRGWLRNGSPAPMSP